MYRFIRKNIPVTDRMTLNSVVDKCVQKSFNGLSGKIKWNWNWKRIFLRCVELWACSGVSRMEGI